MRLDVPHKCTSYASGKILSLLVLSHACYITMATAKPGRSLK